jgi:tRNA pseudouridine38-40 synthase
LEAALATLFRASIKVTGAGRTDSGVHACGQVVSFATERTFPLDRLTVALNAVLPRDCSVRDATAAPPGFSARFSARERTYVYAVLNDASRSALLTHRAHQIVQPLDGDALEVAAAAFVGEHDFRSFGSCAEGESSVRSISRLTVQRRGRLLRIEIAANAFLRRMVRTIVGTLLECGRGRRDPGEIAQILSAADRSLAGPTAPPHGLYLAGVRYDDYDSFAEPPLFAPPDFA